jgi:hypothetical protein
MKIYWGKSNIPELAGLPASVSRKNYNDALYLARSHPQYWAGMVIALAVMVGISLVISHVYKDENSFLFSMISTGCALLPATCVAEQFSITVMRKHYPHILLRGTDEPPEAMRLIDEADANERHQWRYVRWIGQPAKLLVVLIILYCLTNIG